MALQYISDGGGKAAIGYDSATNERGFLVKFINRTGGNSVKGTLVSCSTTADREVVKQASEYDTIAIVQEDGVAEGSEMWCWMSGSVCQVLFKNSTASTRGNILLAADTDGRAIDISNPGIGLPGTDVHFKEMRSCHGNQRRGNERPCSLFPALQLMFTGHAFNDLAFLCSVWSHASTGTGSWNQNASGAGSWTGIDANSASWTGKTAGTDIWTAIPGSTDTWT